MNLEQLKTIYPQHLITLEATDMTDYLSIPIEHQWFHIPLKDLSKSEIKLLHSLSPDAHQTNVLEIHSWYRFLFQHEHIMPEDTAYRIIQVKLHQKSDDANDWLTHFANLFNAIEDYFFINETEALLIEKNSTIHYELSDIEGMILTLQSDFSVKPNVFIGNFHQKNDTFRNFFIEEQTIFTQYQQKESTIFSFQTIALNYLTSNSITQSFTMQALKQTLQLDDDLTTIVKTLWQEKGNLTSTAKKLYIHRNTLQYRLDKFYERTGLSLKNMDDLAICYVLLT
ncbi:hypothetical protein CBF34_01655 [Vagococcus penaei]|uniref:PucR C-terminal helix-turn-helix domain-containing protein n=1 Tax=Vagococcus penaei TaxID=633807 RepID=A0A1Q2D804_9ENTE|nr:helix-turn-helix domain-containing protein [Vagococcus penaei]AQP54482.1 hypothetical protein BW732_09880 [Vagococcus penaei]RSU06810.1 hypothetical protein CBF34_01655 [Vagococcus penaei]